MPKVDWEKLVREGMERGNSVQPKGRREMRCDLCGSTDIVGHLNAGWDIDEEGETHQHEDYCRSCGATRYWEEYFSLEGGKETFWGKFKKREY